MKIIAIEEHFLTAEIRAAWASSAIGQEGTAGFLGACAPRRLFLESCPNAGRDIVLLPSRSLVDEESSRDNLVGIDLLATQYAAFHAYGAIQAILGNSRTLQEALQTDGKIKSLINTTWWNSAQRHFYAFYNKQPQFTGNAGPTCSIKMQRTRGKAESAL